MVRGKTSDVGNAALSDEAIPDEHFKGFPAVSLPAGSYDANTLDAALADAHGVDAEKRDAAIADAVFMANLTEIAAPEDANPAIEPEVRADEPSKEKSEPFADLASDVTERESGADAMADL